jgi:hypothetical protein
MKAKLMGVLRAFYKLSYRNTRWPFEDNIMETFWVILGVVVLCIILKFIWKLLLGLIIILLLLFALGMFDGYSAGQHQLLQPTNVR